DQHNRAFRGIIQPRPKGVVDPVVRVIALCIRKRLIGAHRIIEYEYIATSSKCGRANAGCYHLPSLVIHELGNLIAIARKPKFVTPQTSVPPALQQVPADERVL